MRRPFARVLAGALTLAAGTAAIPLAQAPRAAADGVVIGGKPAKVGVLRPVRRPAGRRDRLPKDVLAGQSAQVEHGPIPRGPGKT